MHMYSSLIVGCTLMRYIAVMEELELVWWRAEEVGYAHVSAFCIHSAHYLPLLKYTIFNCVL